MRNRDCQDGEEGSSRWDEKRGDQEKDENRDGEYGMGMMRINIGWERGTVHTVCCRNGYLFLSQNIKGFAVKTII